MRKFPLILKIVLFQLLFLLLHYLYDWFPNSITTIFSGINESVYQHMKICFSSLTLKEGVFSVWKGQRAT